MTLKFSDNEQKNFIMAVDSLYAKASRLRDVAAKDNWDYDLWTAYEEQVSAMKDLTQAYEALS